MPQIINTPDTSLNLSLQNGSVIKTFQILEQFTRDRPELTISEIAELTGMNRSTVFRFMNSLKSLGMVERTEDGFYKLGIRLFELGLRIDFNQSIAGKARPFLRQLTHAIRESSCLVIRDRVDSLCLVNEQSEQKIRIDTPEGARNPMYCTAHGKAMLAFMDEEFWSLYFSITELKKRTVKTIVTEAELREELQNIRESFISYDYGEYADDVFCVGTPIFDINEHPVAAISVSGLERRMIDRKDMISELVLQTGMDITWEIGGHYPDRIKTGKRTEKKTVGDTQ